MYLMLIVGQMTTKIVSRKSLGLTYVYNSNNVPDRLQLVSSGSIRNFYPVRDFQFLVLVTNVTLQFSCYPQPGCWEI